MKNEESTKFVCRAFGRSELAQMYFPETEPLRAWLRLRRWIQKNCTPAPLVCNVGSQRTPHFYACRRANNRFRTR